MKYTELTKKALRISFDAHKEQYDKTGLQYIFHPFHLAEQFNEEDYICVALLHDVVEDTDITFKDLEKYGFNERIISTSRNVQPLRFGLKIRACGWWKHLF